MPPAEPRNVRPFFPAVVCADYDSPIDALVALCVPRDEAMDLVAASWRDKGGECILTTIDGGRTVAAIRQRNGQWAACHAFVDHACATRHDAERQLGKLLKRGRRGCVGERQAD